uniref:Distal membrane arm assembly complex 2 like n=1 Tax=Pelusios castaneus TaxID=367368 RepID=A0A8C8SIN9_9SAUR
MAISQKGVKNGVPSLCLSEDGDGWVDSERIKAVGPDRAASEWLLRCGALVRYQGYDKWQQDYNGLPTGPLGKYKIQAIDATESCIMHRGFDYLDGLKHVEEIKLSKCIYIQDECLQRISETESLQKSLLRLMIISCGNVTDKGIIALHKLTVDIPSGSCLGTNSHWPPHSLPPQRKTNPHNPSIYNTLRSLFILTTFLSFHLSVSGVARKGQSPYSAKLLKQHHLVCLFYRSINTDKLVPNR